MKSFSLFLALCFLLPPPAFALRGGIEGAVQAGMEEKLRFAGPPPVEVLNPERLRSKKLRGVFWAFDGTLWKGYPHDEADRYFAQRVGLDVGDPRIMKRFHEFILSASGLSWDQVILRLQARHWNPPDDVKDRAFLEEWRKFVDEQVEREKLADPSYLTLGAQELLTAFKASKLRQAIVTGAEAGSRRQYADQDHLNILHFFSDVYGEGQKEEAVLKEMTDQKIGVLEGVFIGDGVKDMEIARRAGLIAVGYAATPEARAAFLALPPGLGPDIIVNGDFQRVDWILSVLGLPNPDKVARLKEHEHMFLQDLEHPSLQPRQYTVYVTELVLRPPPPGKNRAHHVGAMVSLSPYDPPIGFLPFDNTFKNDGGSWVGEKIDLLRRLKEEKHPIEVAVQRKGRSYRPDRHLDFIFWLVEPWTRASVIRFRHSTDRLMEPMFLNALARGIPIPVAVRQEVTASDLEGIQAEVMETIAHLLQQTHFFSGKPESGPFKIEMQERMGSVGPRLLVLENGPADPASGHSIALHQVVARALWEFSNLANTAKATYEGQIILRMEQLDHFLILELMDNGSGVRAEALDQFLWDLLGSKPQGWLAAHGDKIIGRHGGRIEVDTRHRETGAYRLIFDPASKEVELRALRPGARSGYGTTIRWTSSLAGGGYAPANAGAEEKLITYPELLRDDRLPQEEFKLPGIHWPSKVKFIQLPRKGVLLPWGYPELWRGIRVMNPQENGQYLALFVPSGWRAPQIMVEIRRAEAMQSFLSLGPGSAAGDYFSSDGIRVKVVPRRGVVVKARDARRPIYIQRVEVATPVEITSLEEGLIKEWGVGTPSGLFRNPDRSITLYSDPRIFEIARSRLDKEWDVGTPPYTLAVSFFKGAWSLSSLQEVIPYFLRWQEKGWLPTSSGPLRIGQRDPFPVMVSASRQEGWLSLSVESGSVEEMEAKIEPFFGLAAKVLVPVAEPLDSLLEDLDLPVGETRRLRIVLSLARRFYANQEDQEKTWNKLALFLTGTKHRRMRRKEWETRALAVKALENLSRDIKRIRKALPILEVLADPKNGEEFPVQEASRRAQRTLSARLIPHWFEPDALAGRYGVVVRDRVSQLAREADADVAMLLPLNSREDEILRVQPYFYGGETAREQTRQYLEEANRQLAPYGMEFAPLQDPPELGQFERLGLLIYEKDLPKETVPDRYRTLSADRVDPSNPDHYEPLLVAASVVYPMLSLESLRVRVKLAVVVQDEVTGARYLAVLA